MEYKNLEELIYNGYTSKEYKFLKGRVVFRTLYESEIQELQWRDVATLPSLKHIVMVRDILSRSVLSINDCSGEVYTFICQLDASQLSMMYKQFNLFLKWLKEDKDERIIEGIRHIVRNEGYSQRLWNVMKLKGFDEWKEKWNFYRSEWVHQNVMYDRELERNNTTSMLKLLCSFINPEAMKQVDAMGLFGDSGKPTYANQFAEENEKVAKTGASFEQEVDENIKKEMEKQRQAEVGDSLDIVFPGKK